MKIFECKRCGACCQGERVVSISEEEIVRIAKFLNISESEFLKKYTVKTKASIELRTKNGFCIFFDNQNKACKIHPVKPKRCKEWPLIPIIFKDFENFKIVQESCIGLKEIKWEELKDLNLHK